MKSCDMHCNCTIFHQETLNQVEKALYPDDEFIQLVDIFKIYADKTRVKILESIKEHELCVCDLAHLLGVSKSAISHQMTYLKSLIISSIAKNKAKWFIIDLKIAMQETSLPMHIT
jgi:ArsR family transcriptional regulator, lead/cadmium/zinc/bismuth-responsive transcriptional repressor